MTEQVVFKIDKKLKEQAMKKAKRDGTTYSHVLKEATQAYVEDQFDIGIRYNPKFVRRILRASKEPTLRGDLIDLVEKTR